MRVSGGPLVALAVLSLLPAHYLSAGHEAHVAADSFPAVEESSLPQIRATHALRTASLHRIRFFPTG